MKSLFLALLAFVLLLTASADGATDAKSRLVPVQATRVWQMADVSVVYEMPVFWDNHFMAVIQGSGRIVALDLDTGKEIWARLPRPGVVRPFMTLAGDRLVVSNENIVEGIVLSTGTTSWTTELPCEPPLAARFADGLAILKCDPPRTPRQSDAKSPIVGELVVCEGNLFMLGRAGVEVVAAETGKRRGLLRYPTLGKTSRGRRDLQWSLLCESSRLVMDSSLANSQQQVHQVFLREGNDWRPVHGLARGEAVWAFAHGQIIVQGEAGLAGYSLGEGSHAQH